MRCQYCHAEVPEGLMGYHYAGYQQPPCPEVRMALDPAWWPGLVDHYRISETEKAERKATAVRKRREVRRREQAVAIELGLRKRHAPSHAGASL